MNFLNQKHAPTLSDIELIAIGLTSEYTSIGSEYQLFRTLPIELHNRIERSVYNRRKRKLFFHRETLRKKLASHISSDDNYIWLYHKFFKGFGSDRPAIQGRYA